MNGREELALESGVFLEKREDLAGRGGGLG